MDNSYQNSYHKYNFLKSKSNHYIQQSEYILEDLNENDNFNKQNHPFQFNKSKDTLILNKSNLAYLSMAKDHSIMSKSQSNSLIMGQSKLKNLCSFQPNHQRSKASSISNRSNLKALRNVPSLKVLTESDLTENEGDQDDILLNQSDSENVKKTLQPKLCQIMSGQSKTSKQIYQSKEDPTRYTERQKPQQILTSNEDHHYSPQQAEAIDFTFIPGQKLQIRHYSSNQKQICLKQLIKLLSINMKNLRNIRKLSIINCFLSSLEGIEIFDCLQEVNLRKNQLREVEELYRIQSKFKIYGLNLCGNDIQHYNLARFHNLVQVFPSLTELNGKNYSLYNRKQKGDMRKIIGKSAKLQHQLKKTLKKQTKNNYRTSFQIKPIINIVDQQTQRTASLQDNFHEITDNKATEREEFSDEKYQYSSKRSISELKSPKCSNKDSINFGQRKQISEQNEVYAIQDTNSNSYSLGESSTQKIKQTNSKNKNLTAANHLKQISLNNLQNIPITKSVKYQEKSSIQKQTKYLNKENFSNKQIQSIPLQTVSLSKNLLEIRTENLDNQSQQTSQLHQPTATFAMQKQREQQCSLQNKQFMFKNKKLNQSYMKKPMNQPKQEEQMDEEFENEQEDSEINFSRISRISEIPTKRFSHNRRSVTSNMNSKYGQKSRYQYNQNVSEQSFMIGNQLYPNGKNLSFLGFSQCSQYRPNDSMDDDCLLKNNKNEIQQQKMAIANAVYMQSILQKSMLALMKQGIKRKNLPKKRSFF